MMMRMHTYIPVKNCNIVQIEAEVAIISLNPSITINQAVIIRAGRKTQTLLIRRYSNWKQANPQHITTRTSSCKIQCQTDIQNCFFIDDNTQLSRYQL
jgi:hypothetical protein